MGKIRKERTRVATGPLTSNAVGRAGSKGREIARVQSREEEDHSDEATADQELDDKFAFAVPATSKSSKLTAKERRREERRSRLLVRMQTSASEAKAALAPALPATNLKVLQSALPSLDDFFSNLTNSSNTNNKGRKQAPAVGAASDKRVHSRKGRQHAMLLETAQMKQVWAHPSFKNDATQAIKLHVQMTAPKSLA